MSVEASVHVSEVRVHEVAEVVELAAAAGGAVTADQVVHTCSVLARVEGELLASALCQVSDESGVEIGVYVMPGQEPPDGLVARLVDVACRKLRADNVHCCRVHPPEAESFWSHAGWSAPVDEAA